MVSLIISTIFGIWLFSLFNQINRKHILIVPQKRGYRSGNTCHRGGGDTKVINVVESTLPVLCLCCFFLYGHNVGDLSFESSKFIFKCRDFLRGSPVLLSSGDLLLETNLSRTLPAYVGFSKQGKAASSEALDLISASSLVKHSFCVTTHSASANDATTSSWSLGLHSEKHWKGNSY
jgi:hypothetical protein